MYRAFGALILVGVLGCGSSKDRITDACEGIWDTGCSKLVECKVIGPDGTQVTADQCGQRRADAVADCVKTEGAGIAKATDAQVDACVQGFATFACADLCNQVPMDPAACSALGSTPDSDTPTFTCRP